MHFLAVLSMKNRALIALITVVAAIFGGIALTSLKQELAPSIQFPQLAILTQYPGASPDVVNGDVSTPIETAIQSVPGIDTTSSTSSTNQSLISATFVYGTDLATAEQKIDQAISRIKSTLPAGTDPQVISGSISDLPIIQVAVTSNTDTKTIADELTRNTLPDIKAVTGVSSAQLIGQVGQRVTITPDAVKLASAGLTQQAIRDALSQNGVLIPAGSLTENGKTLSVQAGNRLTTVDQIAALPLIGQTPARSGVVTIGDVSAVALGNDPQTSISRVNGKPALTIAVTKLPAANTVEVSQGVRDILPRLQTALGNGAKFTVVFDQAPYIQSSIASLAEEGTLGLVFAVIVILIFLLSIRSTLVTAISIPTSVLITFIAMQGANYTLNIITLGALTIAIGRVVDDSIVVIENIKRHLVAGIDRSTAIIAAVREVAGAITASTITTVAVFLPISFVSGTTGELFRPFALTVTIALSASLLVALTIVPVLAYWFLRPPKRAVHAPHTDDDGDEELEHPTRLQKGYLPIIRWTLKHAVVTILLAILVLGGTIALVPSMKTNFLGSSGQNTFTVTQTLPVGSSLATQDTAATHVEAALRGIHGITTVQLSIGSSGSSLRDAFSGGGAGSITYSVTTDKSVDQTKLQDDVRATLTRITGAGEIVLTASSGFGASSDIQVDITATSQQDLATASDAILASVSKLTQIKQAASNLASSLPYIAVTIDRAKAAQAGLSEVALGSIVAQATEPTAVGSIAINNTTEKIYIQNQSEPTTTAALAALQVPTRTGPVALDTLATVSQVNGPATITTVKGLRSATITATPNSNDLGTASAEVQRAVSTATLPAGATAKLGGATANQSDAFQQLGIALLVAILIVYIVMVATFRSLLQPLLLLVSVPFAATGAIALQVISGVPLGVASLIGVLMLIGIVVTNAIVLVDLVNQYRHKGMSVREALVHGASRRLRPILMTALATIFALLPMAIGLTGSGGFISQPLALVVIGGLISSTFLTLVVLPVLYYLVEGSRERRAARRIGKREAV
ncbi:MAG TPA: efflux RND transporter permease subunit [Microbacteriaceae bacterium]|nr:efflux RND transporter permease subunit [Microbacteriaceae bacterium]